MSRRHSPAWAAVRAARAERRAVDPAVQKRAAARRLREHAAQRAAAAKEAGA